MNSEERKKELLRVLKEREDTVTGAELAEKFHVTRQIIVKDIALLKAEGCQILSTARGYMLLKKVDTTVKKTVIVCHGVEDIEKELQIVVDLGGRVLTTLVEHSVYGALGESLNIKSRKDIKNFLKRISDTGCEPLLQLTKGRHQHTIEADDEKSMEEICCALSLAGYLISI